MNKKFERYTCWTEKSAFEAGFFVLGSRSSVNDGMVAATKVEIPLSPNESSEVITIDDMIDRFMSTFDSSESNSVYAVIGDSGIGKTFAIRCAQTRVEIDERVHVVYVHRDITSLQGILKLILKGLPGKSAADALRQVEETNVEELDTESLLKLVIAQIVVEIDLGHGLGEILSDDSLSEDDRTAITGLYGDNTSGRFKNGLGFYIDIPEVKSHLLREGGVLWSHVQAMRGLGGGEVLNRFESNEIPLVQKARQNYPDLETFMFFFKERRDLAARIIDSVIERALGAQVQTTRNLTEIVGDARRILKTQGKQLVLMFEDIANNGVGLSDAVFDLFRTTMSDDLLPIRVIFAATTGHWPRIPPNVRNTCTRIVVRNLSVDDSEARDIGLQMIARYFNAARIGKTEMLEAWNESSSADRRTQKWVPNKCTECVFRVECHSEFGEVDGFGLYPLNMTAANNVLRHLQYVNQLDGHIGFNPRQIVKTLVSEWLRNSEAAMSLGTFPTAQIEEVVGSRAAKSKKNMNTSEAERQTLSEEMILRIARTRVAWKDYDSTRESYSEVLAKAFGLETSTGVSKQSVPLQVVEVPEANAPVRTTKWFGTDFGDIAEWADSDSVSRMADGRVDAIRDLLLELVIQSLRLDRFLVDPRSSEVAVLISTFLREISIRIEGSKGVEIDKARMQKLLPRSYESYLMITAAFWLKKTKSWNSDFVQNGELIQCEPATLFKGRQVLLEWVDSFAEEVAMRIKSALEDATTAVLSARLRLLTLREPDLLTSDHALVISHLTSFQESYELNEAVVTDVLMRQFLGDFDELVAGSITAFQGKDGRTRLAEDALLKHQVLSRFKEAPDWRAGISLQKPDEMVSLNDKVTTFSINLTAVLESGQSAIDEFRTEIKDLDLEQFGVQLVEFKKVFESLVKRMHTSKDPETVRELIRGLDGGLQTLISEKDLLWESVKQVEELSDPDIWKFIESFPTISVWTLNYRRLMELVKEISDELIERAGNQILPDVEALRVELEDCLSRIQIPSEGN